jgi:putative transposase
MRFVYNQLVNKVVNNKDKYDRKGFQKFTSTLRKETSWMNEVTSRATYEAVDNFHRSMVNFFDSCSGKRKGKKMSLPKFKKKGVKDSFCFSHESQFKVKDRELKIQGLKTTILMRERIRFSGTAKSVTVKRQAGKWFAIFQIALPTDNVVRASEIQKPRIGVDLGISHFATLSTGESIENPRYIKQSEKLLARRQRQLSRKVRGSRRYSVVKLRVSEIHTRVVNQRNHFQHQLVNRLLNNYSTIHIEDLNISGMVKNRHLSRSISDASFSAFRSKLEYKCAERGVGLVIVDRFYPSSKICSCCGYKKESLLLSERTFDCPECGTSLERDHNAAINLLNYQPSPKIKGRRKTDEVEPVSPNTILQEAGLFDVVNNITINIGGNN